MSTDRELLRMFILDVLYYDIEQVASILKLLNANGGVGWRSHWPRAFLSTDIAEALPDLVREGHVDIYDYPKDEKQLIPIGPPGTLPDEFTSKFEGYWYLLTEKGRKVCDEWEPPSSHTD